MLGSRKGQAVVPEYVVMFFVVIAGLVAMTVFVQRSFQARMRDAKVYMMDTVTEACASAEVGRTNAWNLDCQGAANFQNGILQAEYEPYYGMVNAQVSRFTDQSKGFEDGVFVRNFIDQTIVDSKSIQHPPENAN